MPDRAPPPEAGSRAAVGTPPAGALVRLLAARHQEVLADLAPVAVIIVRGPDYEVVEWNLAAERTFGWARAEMLGQSGRRIIPPESTETVDRVVADVQRATDGRSSVNVNVRKDGTRILVEWHNSPIVDEDGETQGILSFAQDVTARYRAEEALRALNAELERRVEARTAALHEALADLETFTYSISHDLRAPVRHVRGYAELLREHLADDADDETRRLLDIIERSAATMGDRVEGLLLLSRVGRAALRPESVDMTAAARRAWSELQPVADAARTVLVLEDLPPAHADRGLVGHVWQNLLDNAVKYSSRHPAPRVEISSDRRGDRTWYVVRDNGIGFAAAEADEMFGAFRRLPASASFPGTGIGLAIVDRIVQSHGGAVRATGRPGEGAEVSFTLEVEPAAAAAEVEA